LQYGITDIDNRAEETDTSEKW